jgi:hypothetical protein
VHVATGHGTGGQGGAIVFGNLLQSALATPSSPPRFVQLSDGGARGPGGESPAALSDAVDQQALLVRLETAEDQHGGRKGPRAARLTVVELATLQAVIDALSEGLPPSDGH